MPTDDEYGIAGPPDGDDYRWIRQRVKELEAGHDAIRKALGLDFLATTAHVVKVIGDIERELEQLRRANST